MMQFIKIIILFSTLILCASCKESKGKYHLKKKGTFEHIDFLSINNENDIKLKKYDYLYENIILEDSSFSIVLVDLNQNNQFNDSEDLVFIDTAININCELNNINFTNLIKANKLFSIDNKTFSIQSILKRNNFYEIELIKENIKIEEIPIQNRMISKLPENLFYENINNEKINILNNQKKFIYIEFWSTSCSPCIELIPEIKKLNDKYSDIIEIHSIAVLNNYNTRDKAFKFVKKNKDFSWNIGFSNTILESQLRFGRLPMGYLFDSEGNLLIFNATPQKIENFLSEAKS